MPIAEMDH